MKPPTIADLAVAYPGSSAGVLVAARAAVPPAASAKVVVCGGDDAYAGALVANRPPWTGCGWGKTEGGGGSCSCWGAAAGGALLASTKLGSACESTAVKAALPTPPGTGAWA